MYTHIYRLNRTALHYYNVLQIQTVLAGHHLDRSNTIITIIYYHYHYLLSLSLSLSLFMYIYIYHLDRTALHIEGVWGAGGARHEHVSIVRPV